MNESLALQTIIIALSAGVFCQLLSETLKTPSILFLLLLGVLLGPQFLAWVQPSSIQGAITPIIELGVAIILFEGGLSLRFDQFKSSSSVIKKMLTQGALITFIGASFAAHWIVGLSWKYCFIFGALMIVSGPTVINPIIRRIPLKKNLSTILNWESILLDPVGALLAIFIADFLLSEGVSYFYTYLKFIKILGVGVVVGIAFGKAMQFLLKKSDSLSEEIVNLLILSAALLSFEVADIAAHHSGLLAVVVSGMVLINGSHTVRRREAILEFKGMLANLWVGFIFILLAARLNVHEVFGIGWPGWLFIGFLLLVIRPLNVFLSTRDSSLSFRDKIFLCWVAPRGIVAASTASLFTLLFEQQDYIRARGLENLTYWVIAISVSLQVFTRGIAHLLGVIEKKNGLLIVGAHPLGRSIALWLKSKSIEVKLVDSDFIDVEYAFQEGLEAYHGDALERSFMENLPLQRIGFLLALTQSNKTNILACQLGNKIIGARSSYQLLPRKEEAALALSNEMGGHLIFPKFPFLDEVNQGLEESNYEWCEKVIPKGFVYEGPFENEGGKFWPLFLSKTDLLTILPSQYVFGSDTQTVGIFRKQ